MIVVHPSTAAAAAAEVRISRALISVHDKTRLVELGRQLQAFGIELVATGGTAAALAAAGLPVVLVEALTGYPELLEGRVKSLHPAIHAGILFQRHLPEHRQAVEAQGIRPIDLVVASLYPFGEARARGAELAELVEYIDVGGPSMVRAAAKNFAHVGVVVESGQYDRLMDELASRRGALGPELRAAFAAEAFAALSAYDAAVAAALGELSDTAAGRAGAPRLPAVLALSLPRRAELRYGENPHQQGAFYAERGASGIAGAPVHQGKELSYNNLLDLDAALAAVSEFPAGGCVIVKHASPAGVAVARSPLDAFRLARDTDPLSAFGGVIGFAEGVDEATAAEIIRDFYEVVVAPSYTAGALALFQQKAALRVVEVECCRQARGPARAQTQVGGRRRAGPGTGLASERGVARGGSGHPAAAERQRARRSRVRDSGGEARPLERHRLRPGRPHGRDRSRPGEPDRRGGSGGDEGGADRARSARYGPRVRRLLPVRRRGRARR